MSYSSAEAADLLGVTPQTLYAYVSRNLIRSEPSAAGQRRRLYNREDVDRLRANKDLRRDPSGALDTALSWGEPLLESALTLIEDGRVYYRGQSAVELARTSSFEEVAALLWAIEPLFPSSDGLPLPFREAISAVPATNVEDLQVLMGRLAAIDVAAYDLRPEAVCRSGGRAIAAMVAAIGGHMDTSIAARLAAAWKRPDAVRAIEAALILCADHELNISAFTVRCIASTAATPYSAIAGGLAAFSGPRHGRASERVASLLDEAAVYGVRRAVELRLQRGEPLPGFGHRLHPDGDLRGRELLRLAAEFAGDSGALALSSDVAGTVRELMGEEPNLDFGLAALARALDLPAEAPMIIFAVGRSAGWVGHALEQYALGVLIRPRARYVGERGESR